MQIISNGHRNVQGDKVLAEKLLSHSYKRHVYLLIQNGLFQQGSGGVDVDLYSHVLVNPPGRLLNEPEPHISVSPAHKTICGQNNFTMLRFVIIRAP